MSVDWAEIADTPVERYHKIGTHELGWEDRHELEEIGSHIRHDERLTPSTRALYLGWLAYEQAVLHEGNGSHATAQRHLKTADRHWSLAHRHFETRHRQMALKVKHATAMAGLRSEVLAQRSPRTAATGVNLHQKRRHLGELATQAYTLASQERHPKIVGEAIGAATELAFSSLLLYHAEKNGDGSKIIAFATAPRVDQPLDSYAFNPAHDALLHAYNQHWHPQHHTLRRRKVQIKTTYDDKHIPRYNPAIIHIAGDAHLHIDSPEAGIDLAQQLSSERPSMARGSHLRRATENVMDEIAA